MKKYVLQVFKDWNLKYFLDPILSKRPQLIFFFSSQKSTTYALKSPSELVSIGQKNV